MKLLLQLRAGGSDLAEELFVLGQEVLDVAGAFVRAVRVLEVEVEAVGADLLDGDAPGLGIFDAGLERVRFVAPPSAFGVEFLDADRLALVVALRAGRIRVLVIPDFLRRGALRKKRRLVRMPV